MATTEKGIYYPNDGKKAADVLVDLKQMAESVDEAIGKEVEENKYNDADIKKDISDIKEEQATQNANIEDLQGNDATQNELISKLKSALINVETEEAKSLHIEDASEVPAQLEVLGNQEQDGEPSPENEVPIICLGSNKNICDIENYVENLTIDTDGTVIESNSYNIIVIPVKANTIYTLSRKAAEEITSNIVYGISSEYPAANKECTYNILKYDVTELQIETVGDTKYILIRKQKFNTDNNLFVDMKIEEGDKATAYSPYRTR